jgi:hypothetical protein
MDPIRVFPYGPAARVKPHIKAGHTSAPDHVDRFNEDSSCINGGVHTHSPSGKGGRVSDRVRGVHALTQWLPGHGSRARPGKPT